MVRIVEYCGIRALAGLTWDLRRTLPADSSTPSLRLRQQARKLLAAPPAAVVIWDDRRAQISERKAVGLPALSRIVLDQLPDELHLRVVLAAIAEPDLQLFTAFILVSGKPVIGPEHVFDNDAALRAAIGDLVSVSGIEVIAASAGFGGLEGLGIPRFDLIQTDLDPRTLPVAERGRAPARTALLAGTGMAAVLLFGSTAVDSITDFISPPPPPVSASLSKVPDWAGFVEGCLAAHAEEWPSVPGWLASSRGCRVNGPGLPAIAWRTFQLDGQRNLIISQRVAEMMYRDWPHRMTITDGQLSTETNIPLQWSDASPADPTDPPLVRQVEDAFVGIERAIVAGGDGLDTTITLSSDAPLPDVLTRVARLDAYWIDSIEQSTGGTELKLRAPPQPFPVPGDTQ